MKSVIAYNLNTQQKEQCIYDYELAKRNFGKHATQGKEHKTQHILYIAL